MNEWLTLFWYEKEDLILGILAKFIHFLCVVLKIVVKVTTINFYPAKASNGDVISTDWYAIYCFSSFSILLTLKQMRMWDCPREMWRVWNSHESHVFALQKYQIMEKKIGCEVLTEEKNKQCRLMRGCDVTYELASSQIWDENVTTSSIWIQCKFHQNTSIKYITLHLKCVKTKVKPGYLILLIKQFETQRQIVQ